MSLVQYSDSDSEPDQPAPPARSATFRHDAAPLPPLPASFHDLYSTNTRLSTTDDPTLHGGRRRAIPHREGQWPSHVYLEWHPTSTESRTLHALIERVHGSTALHYTTTAPSVPEQQIHTLLLTPLSTPAPLHISLSRSLPLPTDGRDPFITALTTRVRHSSVRPFSVSFDGLKWVPNFDRSRWFLVLGVKRPENDALNRLLLAANQAAKQFGYPELYNSKNGKADKGNAEGVDMSGGWGANTRLDKADEGDAQKKYGMVDRKDDRSDAYHISLAWSLEAPPESLRNPSADEDVAQWMEKDVSQMDVRFDVVKAKIGNAVHSIELAPKRKEEKGILG